MNTEMISKRIDELLQSEDRACAMEVALNASALYPSDEGLKQLLEYVRKKRAKIAFFCGADGVKFLWDIGMFAKSRFETRFFDGQTLEEMTELMKWSDISWFEWCTEMPVVASQLPKVCKNIIRLHRYEAFTHWPAQINWDNIDTLITIGNDYVRSRLIKTLPDIELKTHIVDIPNGINLDKFKLYEKSRGKNIAFVGSLNMKKNPAYLLHCFKALHMIDPDYRLFIAGKYQDEVLEQYMSYMINELGLNESIFFEGWHDDINKWLTDKHYIVSSSIVEGHPVGVMEAMACGLKPVVHNFPGARKFFPKEFLYEGVGEFCEMILSGDYEPYRYRRFIEESYPLQEQLRLINEVFIGLESELASNQGTVQPLITAGSRQV